MTAVTETPAAPPEETAPTAVDQNLAAANHGRGLHGQAHRRHHQAPRADREQLERRQRGIAPHIGEPTVGQYVAFDVAALSPIQITGLPPYQPSKVIAAGEAAYLVVYMWVNPMASIPDGFAVPPTVQLGEQAVAGLAGPDEHHRPDPHHTGADRDLRPCRAVAVGRRVHAAHPDPGPDAAVYEANVTLDIVNPAQPYAAFATNFFDVDTDPGFLFVPPTPPGWRHELPNRYLVYGRSSSTLTADAGRTGFRRPASACRLPVSPRHGSVPELAEDAGQVGPVGRAEPAEGPFGLGAAGRADGVQDAGAVLGQLDQGGPPVARVGPPLGPGRGPPARRRPRWPSAARCAGDPTAPTGASSRAAAARAGPAGGPG